MSNKKIKIGICGNGNIGKAVETVISNFPDMELVCIFSRRDPQETTSSVPVRPYSNILDYKGKIDVMMMCGGSATDLPYQVPEAAKHFNTVDSFDTHADIPMYYEKVDVSAMAGNNTSLISGGWDPGDFSEERAKFDAFMPQGLTHTFWGNGERGLSQGHSQAIRKKVANVKGAVQYTIMIPGAVERVVTGQQKTKLKGTEMHTRECFVVVDYSEIKAKNEQEFAEKKAALEQQIETDIKTMPKYFAGYDTTVHFITEEELKKNHSEMRHGGFVIHVAETGNGHKHVLQYSLKLDSNPEYTASVLLAYARAVYRMNQAGQYGAQTVFDVPVTMLSSRSREELLKSFL